MKPERRLAFAVLARAGLDLIGAFPVTGDNPRRVATEAAEWVAEDGSFDWWCEAADLDPGYVRERLLDGRPAVLSDPPASAERATGG